MSSSHNPLQAVQWRNQFHDQVTGVDVCLLELTMIPGIKVIDFASGLKAEKAI